MIPLFKPWTGKEEIEAVKEVIESGWLGLGPKTQKLEEEISKYVNSKYSVALNSCTAALDLAIKSLGIKSGEILVPSLTFVTTVNVALYNNSKPVFIDIKEDTLCMDPEDIKKKITDKTKAIIPVHYSGHPCDLDEILEIAKENNIPVIEDAAHALGSEYKGKKIGSIGDIACFSFHPVKNIATGDGGMLTTNNEEVFEKAKKMRWFNISSTFERAKKTYSWYYEIDGLGYKYHMNDVIASIALAQLKKLEKANGRRRKIAETYNKELEDLEWIQPPVEKPYVKHTWLMYVVKMKNRDKFMDYMKEKGISTGVHYMPIHMHPFYKELIKKSEIKKPDVPLTDKIWQELVTLPSFPDMTKEELEKIISTIKSFKN